MFESPKALLQLWSDYDVVLVDIKSVIEAYLDRLPAFQQYSLGLERIADLGIKHPAVLNDLKNFCHGLQNSCLINGRFLLNVDRRQELTEEQANLIHTPISPSSEAMPKSLRRFFRWRKRSLPPAGPVNRVRSGLKPWSQASLGDGDLVLIDAPLSSVNGEEPLPKFVLSDFPDSLRQRRDPVVRLILSESLANGISAAVVQREWHPFCRTLGIVHRGMAGDSIRVLQMSFRAPLQTSSPWQSALADEAGIFRFTGPKREDVYVGEAFRLAESLINGKRNEDPTKDVDALIASFSSEISAIVRGTIRYEYELNAIALSEDSCYAEDNGFWVAALSLLAGWREQFPLNESDVLGLLTAFDAGYNSARLEAADVLRICGLSRFGSRELASLRQRIASLAPNLPAPTNRQSFKL